MITYKQYTSLYWQFYIILCKTTIKFYNIQLNQFKLIFKLHTITIAEYFCNTVFEMYLANVKITHILFTIIDCKYIIKLNKFKINKC